MVGYDAAVKLNHLKDKGRKPESVGAAQTPHVVTVEGSSSSRISTHRGCKLLNAVGPLARDRQQH
jgi:hypothetical protein